MTSLSNLEVLAPKTPSNCWAHQICGYHVKMKSKAANFENCYQISFEIHMHRVRKQNLHPLSKNLQPCQILKFLAPKTPSNCWAHQICGYHVKMKSIAANFENCYQILLPHPALNKYWWNIDIDTYIDNICAISPCFEWI